MPGMVKSAEICHRTTEKETSVDADDSRPRGPFQDVGLQSVFRGGTETGRAMADCLHCEINQLVQQRLEGGHGDLAEIASMVAESLADPILLAPEGQQANLIAYVVSGSRADVPGKERRGRGRLQRHSLKGRSVNNRLASVDRIARHCAEPTHNQGASDGLT